MFTLFDNFINTMTTNIEGLTGKETEKELLELITKIRYMDAELDKETVFDILKEKNTVETILPFIMFLGNDFIIETRYNDYYDFNDAYTEFIFIDNKPLRPNLFIYPDDLSVEREFRKKDGTISIVPTGKIEDISVL